MANIYVRSTDGSNADNGSTWALAKADLAGAAAIDAAGDTIYVSQAHAESTAGAITVAFAGTLASPTRIIGGNDGAEPPTAVSTAPTVTTTGANAITLNSSSGGQVYIYGINFSCGTGASAANMLLENTTSQSRWVYEKCSFTLGTSNSTSNLQCTGGQVFLNCDFKFNSSGQSIKAQSARFIIEGGSILAGGTSPITLFADVGSDNRSVDMLISGMDLTNLGASSNLMFDTANTGQIKFIIRDSKLPSSWSGTLNGGSALRPGHRLSMYNCASDSKNYRLWIEDPCGSIKDETTIVKTSGASDGTTALSWKMATNTNPSSGEYLINNIATDEIVQWNEDTGSSKTLTIDIIHDSVTNLKDDEVWVDVMYLSSSSVPQGTMIADCKADILATAADQDSSSAIWTTTGLTNPNKQKLVVTFTPQMKGVIHARVRLAKASYTIYVDPLIQIT
jgi:hypothetical protein